MCLNYSERFQLLNPTVNIAYLRPYRLRTSDIGPPPKSLSAKPVEVELDGSSWYQVEDIPDHRGKTGPMCHGRYSVLKDSNSLPSSATNSPITATSKTSDVVPIAPTARETVAPIVTSSGQVIRRPTFYRDSRR